MLHLVVVVRLPLKLPTQDIVVVRWEVRIVDEVQVVVPESIDPLLVLYQTVLLVVLDLVLLTRLFGAQRRTSPLSGSTWPEASAARVHPLLLLILDLVELQHDSLPFLLETLSFHLDLSNLAGSSIGRLKLLPLIILLLSLLNPLVVVFLVTVRGKQVILLLAKLILHPGHFILQVLLSHDNLL